VAAGGGGSWKVAYADFVTAMMAFFLVMWICGQDQQTREAVAHYFNEPFQFFKDPVGASRKPDKSRALFQEKSSGVVPDSDKVILGRGRESFTPNGGSSPATKTVTDFLQASEKSAAHWRAQAQQAIQTASRSLEAAGEPARIEQVAVQLLAEQLASELTHDVPPRKGESLHDDLLAGALAEVNWTEVAEDLVRQERLPNSGRSR
jgi:flagellar motor protein MotB